jgi:hypothetical protein
MSATLLAVGTVLEVLGAGMVAAPEIAPLLSRATRTVLGSRLATRVRLLVRGRRDIVVDIDPAMEINFATRVSGSTSVADDASDERKLAWLLTQAKETEERLDKVERELADESERRREEIEELRGDFETRVSSEIRRESELYLTLRRLGVVLVIAGVVLVSIGSAV